MRKLLSFLLLAVLGLPFVSPLFAQGTLDASRLPACCRRGGAHRCAGMQGETGTAPAVRTQGTRCPYCPGALIAPHVELSAAPAASATLLRELTSEVSASRETQQTSSARFEEQHLRGPPSYLL